MMVYLLTTLIQQHSQPLSASLPPVPQHPSTMIALSIMSASLNPVVPPQHATTILSRDLCGTIVEFYTDSPSPAIRRLGACGFISRQSAPGSQQKMYMAMCLQCYSKFGHPSNSQTTLKTSLVLLYKLLPYG